MYNIPTIGWNQLSPAISYANQLCCHSHESFGPRIISDHQFIFVACGKGEAVIQSNPYKAEPGDLFYYGPGVVHTFTADPHDPFLLFGVHFNWSSELNPDSLLQPPLITTLEPQQIGSPLDRIGKIHNQASLIENHMQVGDGDDSLLITDKQRLSLSTFLHYFKELVDVYTSHQAFAPVLLRALFTQLLVAMKQSEQFPTHSPETSHPAVLEAAAKLDERAKERYSREWLGEWTSYHPDYIARLFREQTGWTPYDYFMHRKLELVKQLLLHSDQSLLEIADHVNGGSIHAFTKWFKSMTGMPPGQFRKRRRGI